MTDSPHRRRPYPPQQGPPPQGGPSYGPPPSYQGSQWQQPQGSAQQWRQQPPQQQWQQSPQDAYGAHGGYESYDDTAAAAELPLAPILRRAGARLLDNTLVAVFGFALVLPLAVGAFGLDAPGSKTETEGGVWNWPIIFTLFTVLSVLPFLYEGVQLAMSGRTLGKRMLGLGVVRVSPAGEALTTTQAIWRSAITHVAYQFGVFFFLVLAVMVWDYLAYGMLLVWAGALMAYLWAIWDQPLHQSLHDRFAGTLVIDERVAYGESESGYGEYSEYEE